jgi:hypothetical protein
MAACCFACLRRRRRLLGQSFAVAGLSIDLGFVLAAEKPKT